jgi:hypothetical protein
MSDVFNPDQCRIRTGFDRNRRNGWKARNLTTDDTDCTDHTDKTSGFISVISVISGTSGEVFDPSSLFG